MELLTIETWCGDSCVTPREWHKLEYATIARSSAEKHAFVDAFLNNPEHFVKESRYHDEYQRPELHYLHGYLYAQPVVFAADGMNCLQNEQMVSREELAKFWPITGPLHGYKWIDARS